jgi:hypothetical protein
MSRIVAVLHLVFVSRVQLVVGSLVAFTIVGPFERFRALIARKRVLLCVREDMPAERVRACKAKPTLIARVRLLAAVNPHVRRQVALLAEVLATDFTLEWLLSSVRKLVPHHHG